MLLTPLVNHGLFFFFFFFSVFLFRGSNYVFCVESHNMSQLAPKQQEYVGLSCQQVVTFKATGVFIVNTCVFAAVLFFCCILIRYKIRTAERPAEIKE